MENKMEQSAVEWLLDSLDYNQNMLGIKEIIEKAKEMEKKQIIDAFEKGYENGACVSDEESIYHGGNYYNKTFK
jgi:hypothetical protein